MAFGSGQSALPFRIDARASSDIADTNGEFLNLREIQCGSEVDRVAVADLVGRGFHECEFAFQLFVVISEFAALQ